MNAIKQYDERSVLAEVAQGNEDAFAILFNQYRHKIIYFAWKFLQSNARAEDVLQEIFLKVWMNRSQLADIKNFKAWLTTITRNHIFNALRKMAVEEAFITELSRKAGQQHEDTVLNSLSFNELQQALRKAVSNLTPQQKKVFELSRMEGLKHEQIAERLEISRETVKKHMTDALRHIRQQMKSPEMLAHLTLFFLIVRL
jgi:RNA polymerase sigma-70 factor (ECF subfamily)